MSIVYEWHTTITDVAEASICVRGFPLAEIIRTRNFVEVAFLTLRGRFPQPREQRMLEAGLISLVDHGFVSSDVTAARSIVSENPSVIAGLAGGVLAAGTSTLSPENAAAFIEKALEMHRRLGGLLEETASVIVSEIIEKRERIPGLGHVTHKHEDPRVPALRAVAAGNLIAFPDQRLTRMGPGVLDATEELCRAIDAARRRLGN